MGLLDWLTDGVGSDLGIGGGKMPPGMYPGGGEIPMPPVQQTGMDVPKLVDPATQAMPGGQGAGPMPPSPATDAMPGGQGGPAPSPIPMPQARPEGAPPPNANADPAALPPQASATAGPPMQIAPPGLPPQGQSPGMMEQVASQGILGRALGLTPNTSNRLRSSLAAGLKSVPENSTKFGLAAASGSAGSAMEGGQKRDDTTYDQKLKALSQAVAAKSRGDEATYKTGYLKYLGTKLKADQEAAASSGGGRSGAWNKPDSQKFIDASNALSRDRQVIAAQKTLEQAQKDGDPKRIAQAQTAFDTLSQKKRAEYLAGVGLDPKQIEFNIQNPPGSQKNPFKVTSQQDFERYVKPGQAYINPKDGKIYIRNGEGAGTPNGGTSSATPNTAKPAPMNPLNPGQGTMPAADDNED